MDPNFVELVRKMRAAQQSYFRTRTMQALKDAKRLEAEVDHLLSQTDSQQPSLFDAPEVPVCP